MVFRKRRLRIPLLFCSIILVVALCFGSVSGANLTIDVHSASDSYRIYPPVLDARLQQKQRAAEQVLVLSSLVAGVDYTNQEILIEAASHQEAMKAAKAYGARLVSFDAHGFAILQLDQSMTVSEAVSSGVDTTSDLPAAFPNLIYRIEGSGFPDSFPDDPDLLRQLHHTYCGSYSAWQTTPSGGKIPIVAVIDTGIDADHPELAEQILPSSWNAHTQQYGISSVEDDNGHGTQVAGLISARQNNGKGGSGVAPGSLLMIIKANNPTSPETVTTASLIRAIYHAADHGADIINISLGRPYASGSNTLELQAITYAVGKGVMVIAAAGNDGESSVSYPAAYSSVIAVTAGSFYGHEIKFASFSNYGAAIDLCAPGVNIYSTIRTGGYGASSGTSMAAPIVSGAAALLMFAYPEESALQIQQRLYSSAMDLGTAGFDIKFGHGFLDIAKAMAMPTFQVALPGQGTADDPYLIGSATELLWLATMANTYRTDIMAAHYKLVNDIDLAGSPSWLSIGSSGAPFTGVFDGNSHVIANLNIRDRYASGQIYEGLFGKNNGTIQNVILEDVSIKITGLSGYSAYTGGICGYNEGIIRNCRVSGTIDSVFGAGGMTNINHGLIEHCINTSHVTALANAGGIAGHNTYTKILDCQNYGTIRGSSDVGGIAGTSFNYGCSPCLALYRPGRTRANTCSHTISCPDCSANSRTNGPSNTGAQYRNNCF